MNPNYDMPYYDPEATADANYQHLRHFFDGYRAAIIGDKDDPYSPGSARSVSWQLGFDLGTKDTSLA